MVLAIVAARRRSRGRRGERLRGHPATRRSGAGHDDGQRSRRLLEHRGHHRDRHRQRGHRLRLQRARRRPRAVSIRVNDKPRRGTCPCRRPQGSMPLAAGSHKLKYWAQDINGNVEAQHVRSASRSPRTRGQAGDDGHGCDATAAGTRPACTRASRRLRRRRREGSRSSRTTLDGAASARSSACCGRRARLRPTPARTRSCYHATRRRRERRGREDVHRATSTPPSR